QEGWGREAVWSGLCRGLAQTIVMTLFRGRRPQGTVVLAGGVADNPQVVSWIARDLDGEVVIASDPALASARGTAHLASRPMVMAGRARAIVGDAQPPLERRPPLVLRRSHHPAFEVEEAWTDAADNEIRVTSWPRDRLRGFLGVDVGSTSTKLALVDEDERVVLDIYRRTAGDPAGAARALLQALSELAAARSLPVEILGVGTTGSGRRLVGALLGADRVVNEITAHVTGALWADPSVETIFEIGGQDAKYIHAKGGRLRNSNMNYVCAAGTGSFVEELARKLGFPLEEIGDAVEGLSPPLTSDRCTVFMEQDARDLLRRGVPRREVMGSILYSVIRNYLSRVVGGRPVSASRIFFQGATARNRGLVAALENLLDVEVVVSPFCHVMGSVGVALLTLRALRGTGASTRFPGLEAARRPVTLRQDTCTLCNNRCTITTAELGEGSDGPSWGYLCGRDPAGKPGDGGREFELVRERERLWRRPSEEERSLPPDAPLLATPRALQAWTWAPFWRAFFAGLGYRLVLSGRTTRELVERGNAWVGADACFPVKLAHGHLRELLDDPRGLRIFLPHMIAAPEHPAVTGTHFCPYNAGLPAMLRAAAELGGADTSRLLSATMDLRWDPERAARRLHQDLGAALERPREAFLAAWNAAVCAMEAFRGDLSAAGQRGLAALRESGRPGVVILGRAYNTYDEGANLELPRKLAGLGLTVVPLDLLPPAD
ncbi:MAG: hypothetical protein FJ098_13465, partial [Deltaproteobacteria bacterium]|nr:hypothetical protein [Deltaproteobacteria bacterium]